MAAINELCHVLLTLNIQYMNSHIDKQWFCVQCHRHWTNECDFLWLIYFASSHSSHFHNFAGPTKLKVKMQNFIACWTSHKHMLTVLHTLKSSTHSHHRRTETTCTWLHNFDTNFCIIYSVKFSASEMNYIVSGGALNSTHSLTLSNAIDMNNLRMKPIFD